MNSPITRRRFINILGTVSAFAFHSPQLCFGRAPTYRWNGTALGANSSITLVMNDQEEAKTIVALCLTEIDRLERIFSLFIPDSAIRSLNQTGILNNPPAELIELVSEARQFSELSDGAFDVSIQPLWRYLYYLESAPEKAKVESLRNLINYRKIRVSKDRIWFEQQGMEITLNGIAQGFITDKVTALLQSKGLANVLVELGESYALGQNPSGCPWRIGIQDPQGPGVITTVDLQNQALATSGAYGTPFRSGDSMHHLINATTASAACLYKSLSVISNTALQADGLSTALSLIENTKHKTILQNFPGARAIYRR